MEEDSFRLTPRSRVRRHPERSTARRATVHAILDEGLVAHVGFVVDGQPVVIPMAYGRRGDALLLHGAVGGRLARALAGGVAACATVTLLDGLVLARSTFHSSMNYRSVVAFGRARLIEGEEERRAALAALTEHLVPGRSAVARGPSARELASTAVLELAIEEATAKVRSGPPIEPEDDVALEVWAGVVPLALCAGPAQAAPDLRAGTPTPDHVRNYRRPHAGPLPRFRAGASSRRLAVAEPPAGPVGDRAADRKRGRGRG